MCCCCQCSIALLHGIVFCCATMYLPKSFHHALLLLFVHVASCYSYCIACVLVRYYSHRHHLVVCWWSIANCCLPPVTKYPPSPSPFLLLVLLLFCHIATVVLHKFIWFFFFIYIAFSCENKKWPSLLKMKIG
jgi:hypothetical protein